MHWPLQNAIMYFYSLHFRKWNHCLVMAVSNEHPIIHMLNKVPLIEEQKQKPPASQNLSLLF